MFALPDRGVDEYKRFAPPGRGSVGTAKPDGNAAYRNGFVTDLDIAHANVAETAACGRARWRIGNRTFSMPGTDGYDPGHNFGRGRRGPANLPVVPDLLALAARPPLKPLGFLPAPRSVAGTGGPHLEKPCLP